MLRITTIDKGQITILRLEGRLVGDWVDEFERCWIVIKSADPQQTLKIDLRDVEFVDEKGEALLERLFLDGAELHADNPFLKSVVARIVEHSKSERANGRGGVAHAKKQVSSSL
jgi:ABC-type transporter Mla MlaB component